MNETEKSYWQSLLTKNLPRRSFLSLLASAGVGGVLIACTSDDDDEQGSSGSNGTGGGNGEANTAPDGAERPESWTEISHSNDAEPDYGVVFPADRVNQMTLTVTPENWQAMLDDMTELFGERGSGQGTGQQGGGFGQRPADGEMPEDGAPPEGFQDGGPGGGGGFGGDFKSENPIWVPATVGFNGLEWTNVGLRFKGNSSLRSSWSGGTDKLPFKLDFDEFEGDYPEIDNQRFYGFKQLSLANNWGDASNLREALAYDLLDDSSLVAAQTGFYEIMLDHDEGPQSLGLYTVIEVIDDTVIGAHFDDDSGNIYEADGSASSFAEGTRDTLQDSFAVESEETHANGDDLRALYDALHASTRTTDVAAWRQSLEAVFVVDDFLKWLALSTVIQHWDTYGGMPHNFYLYNDPETARLNWISWDHNLVLGAGGSGGGGGGGNPAGGGGGFGGRGNTSFDKSGVGANWPLIGYLIAVPEYKAKYDAYVEEIITGIFEASAVETRIRSTAELLAPYSDDSTSYTSAIDSLVATVQERVTAARTYLESV